MKLRCSLWNDLVNSYLYRLPCSDKKTATNILFYTVYTSIRFAEKLQWIYRRIGIDSGNVKKIINIRCGHWRNHDVTFDWLKLERVYSKPRILCLFFFWTQYTIMFIVGLLFMIRSRSGYRSRPHAAANRRTTSWCARQRDQWDHSVQRDSAHPRLWRH